MRRRTRASSPTSSASEQTAGVTVKRLALIRHAKAKQGDRDIERPLARRGREDARVIGEWLAERAVPDVVLVSPSERTRETWQCASAVLPSDAVCCTYCLNAASLCLACCTARSCIEPPRTMR